MSFRGSRAEPTGAAHQHARRAVELPDDGGGARLLGAADGAGEQVAPGLHLVQMVGPTTTELAGIANTVPRSRSLSCVARRRARGGRGAVRPAGRRVRPGRRASAPSSGRTGLRAGDVDQQRVPDLGSRTDAGERRRRPAARERRHPLAARSSAPDEDSGCRRASMNSWNHACSTAPSDPHVLEHAAHPRHQRAVGLGGKSPVEGVRRRSVAASTARAVAGERRWLRRRRPRPPRCRSAPGAADPRLQAELEHRVEQQPSPDPRPHRSRNLAGERPPPERRELGAVRPGRAG